jgi:hypothetical protein
MLAPAPRNARACTAPDARQPRCSVLTTHPTPAFVLSRANLGAQGGLDFLSAQRGASDDPACPIFPLAHARTKRVRTASESGSYCQHFLHGQL